MTSIAILLVLCSAFMHAGWNLFSKRQHPSQALFCLSSACGTIMLIPILIVFWPKVHLFPTSVWWLLGITGFFEALYYVSLAGAYRKGDMSLAYPLARSSPVIVITFVTFALGQGGSVGKWAIVGIVLVVAGCFILPMKQFNELKLRNYLNPCCLLAFFAAIGTAGYTIVDDRALSILRGLPNQPFNAISAALIYLFFEGISSFVWQIAGLTAVKKARENLWFTISTSIKPAAIMGAGIYLTYGLALTAMAFVSNVSYVAAFRQLSIPIGVGFGALILKEPMYRPKVLGVAVILTGLIMVGLG